MSRNQLALTLILLVNFNTICISKAKNLNTENLTLTTTDRTITEASVTNEVKVTTVPALQTNIEVNNNDGEVSDTSTTQSTTITTNQEEVVAELVSDEGFKTGEVNETTSIPWWKRRPYPLRQRARPCQCLDYKCGCCAGMSIQRLNVSQNGCLNFKYDPDEFSIEMEMLMNQRAVFRRSVSAKNPPPICIPIPSLVSFIPRVEFCTRMFNIFTPGRNLHMCLDWTTKVNTSPVLEVQFDCLRVGADGVAVVKPDAGGGLPDGGGGGGGGGDYGVVDAESEDYDPLDPEYPESGNKRPNKPGKKPSNTTTIAP